MVENGFNEQAVPAVEVNEAQAAIDQAAQSVSPVDLTTAATPKTSETEVTQEQANVQPINQPTATNDITEE